MTVSSQGSQVVQKGMNWNPITPFPFQHQPCLWLDVLSKQTYFFLLPTYPTTKAERCEVDTYTYSLQKLFLTPEMLWKTDSSQVLLLGKGHLGQTWDVMSSSPELKAEREFKGSCQYLSKEFAFGDSKLCPSYIDVKLVSSFKVEIGRGGKFTWKIVGKSVGSSLKTKGICEERSKGNMERLSNMRHLSSHVCFLSDIPFPAPNLT